MLHLAPTQLTTNCGEGGKASDEHLCRKALNRIAQQPGTSSKALLGVYQLLEEAGRLDDCTVLSGEPCLAACHELGQVSLKACSCLCHPAEDMQLLAPT